MNDQFFPFTATEVAYDYDLDGSIKNYFREHTFNLYDVKSFEEFVDGDGVFLEKFDAICIHFKDEKDRPRCYKVNFHQFNLFFRSWTHRLNHETLELYLKKQLN